MSKGYVMVKTSDVVLPHKRIVVVSLFVITTTVFAFIFWKRIVLQSSSDLHVHIEYARNIRSLHDLESPHFLFQLAIIAFSRLTKFSLEIASACVLGACYGAMAAALSNEIRRQHPSTSVGSSATLALMGLFATHIFIVTLFVPNFYFGYFNVTAYHNPTQQLNKLFALVIWLIYCREFLAGIIVKTQVLCLLALFCVLSAISKPSFLIVFLPLAGVVALWDLFCAKYRMFWSYVFAIAVPSCLVLAWQFWITYGSGEGGIQIDPFAVVTREYLFRLPLSLAFPITVTCLMWREAAQSKRFVLTWAIFLLGMLYVCFLAEAGVRKFQGNFGWTSQTVQYLLYVESLLLTLGALGTKRRVLLSVFCVHVAFGIVYAIAAAFFPVELWA